MSAYDLQIAVYNELARASLPTLTADFAADTYSLYSAKVEGGVAYIGENAIGIYDNPTQVSDPGDNSKFPYITISDDDLQPWDSDTEIGTEATVRVHVWSRAQNSLEAKKLQDAIYNVLHRGNLTITGYDFIACDMVLQTIERDPDGITRHGIQDFRVIYDQQ